MSLRIRKNDTVVVLLGKSKGKKGKLLRLSPDGSRGYVEGANLVKRRVRPSAKNPQGGHITHEASIHLSNVGLYCPKCDKASRFRTKELGDGTSVRMCSRCDTDLSQGK